MSVTVLGHAVSRREDPALLRGEVRFVADLPTEGGLHAHFVRSAAASARLAGVDTAEARRAPGVLGVWTAADLALPGLDEYPPPPDGPRPHLRRPCLAVDRVRFVGEAVAVVVAECHAAAVDAPELVTVDLEELAVVVVVLAQAAREGAPLLFPEHGSNVVIALAGTDPGALEGAEVVVRGRYVNQRVAPVPIEPGGVLAQPAEEGG
jgi:carbon-monoxide dehydrogenase large subunit